MNLNVNYHNFSDAVNGSKFGDELNFRTFNSFQLSDKFTISPILRYSELRSKVDRSLYYKGYISRINFNYQFNRDFSIRLITEYDDFDKTFFSQPLIKWNPNLHYRL